MQKGLDLSFLSEYFEYNFKEKSSYCRQISLILLNGKSAHPLKNEKNPTHIGGGGRSVATHDEDLAIALATKQQ